MTETTVAILVAGIGVTIAVSLFVLYQIRIAYAARERNCRHLDNGQRIEIDPSDPTDPMLDPAVRAMFSEVLRTGRPMAMNRGEAPRFVDDDAPSDTSGGGEST